MQGLVCGSGELCFDSSLLRVGVRSVIVGVAWFEMCCCYTTVHLSINIQRHCASGLSRVLYLFIHTGYAVFGTEEYHLLYSVLNCL